MFLLFMHLPLQYTNGGRHDSEIFWVGGHFVSMDVKLNALNKIKYKQTNVVI